VPPLPTVTVVMQSLSHYIGCPGDSNTDTTLVEQQQQQQQQQQQEEDAKYLGEGSNGPEIGDEYGDSILLFGDSIGEIVEVSSERPYGLFSNVQATNGAWHTCSKDNVLMKRRRQRQRKGGSTVLYGDQVEHAIVDFGGEGDDIYELDYMWLRNEHSSAYSIEYKDIHGDWVVYQPWTAVEPFEFITLKKKNIKAAELKLLVKGSKLWDASWVLLKVYGRSDPITNFLRDLKEQILAHDDIDKMRALYKEGLKLNLKDREEMEEAAIVKYQMTIREEAGFAVDANDMTALKKIMEEAAKKNMLNDVKIMEAGDTLARLVAEQNYKYSHPAYKLMRNCDIDEAASTKYLKDMIDVGYDCLFGLATVIEKIDIDGGAEANDILRNTLFIRNAVHRERLIKMIPRMKLQRQDLNNGLEKFMLSINFHERDVKKYNQQLWDIRKYDTLFDLLNCEREELELANFKIGHIEAVLMIQNGKYGAYNLEDE